jgi:hypothetical protein
MQNSQKFNQTRMILDNNMFPSTNFARKFAFEGWWRMRNCEGDVRP